MMIEGIECRITVREAFRVQGPGWAFFGVARVAHMTSPVSQYAYRATPILTQKGPLASRGAVLPEMKPS